MLTEVFPPRTGGSGRWFWELYRRLPREDFVVMAGEDPRQDAFDRTHDLRLVRAPLSLPTWGILHAGALRGHWRIVRRLRRLAKAERVEMIHCGRCLPEGLMALELKALTGIPFACFVHGEEMTLASQSRELRWLTRRVLGSAAYLIANSRNSARILRDDWGVPADRVVVLHPGVDSALFVPAPRDPDVRDELGWGDRTVLLTVGRLQERKGHDRMIEALSAIRRTIPDILYAIVGDGEEAGRLRELVDREGLRDHVQFLGERDDRTMVRCYQQCDLFVLPNRRVGNDIEGFGIVLLEAQACGKPVVAGDSGGTVETMKVGETGRIVSCERPEPLAGLILELLADRERLADMGRAARRWIVGNLDWDVLVDQAAQLFLARGGGARLATTAATP
jgi:phosphatidylinositol alpha-1,6-mannosyltransferase